MQTLKIVGALGACALAGVIIDVTIKDGLGFTGWPFGIGYPLVLAAIIFLYPWDRR